MYEILSKKALNATVEQMEIKAPFVAKRAKAGQFIILRVDENGERVPLTIADYDREKGSITIIYQIIGKSTQKLSQLHEGDALADFVGPLGKPSEIDDVKKAIVVGGGVGCAIALPVVKALSKAGKEVTAITGFREASLVILEDQFKRYTKDYHLFTDDGSKGSKGFVTQGLEACLKENKDIDCVYAIGPLPMMKFVSLLTEKYGVKTIVSMNPIMIDGTGMCGGCRLTVGGETKFACIDGPEFDGHLVDFDEALMRNSIYEKSQKHQEEACHLLEKEVQID